MNRWKRKSVNDPAADEYSLMPANRMFRTFFARSVLLMICLLATAPCSSGAGPQKGEESKRSKDLAADESSGSKSDGKVVKSDAEWRKRLTRQQYRVTRQKGTEPQFKGAYWKTKKDGIYQCVCCELPLFDSRTKYDSGTGWPSFWMPIDEEAVTYREDRSEPEVRTEVLCSRCDAHLGHVFADGPRPTGQRFCMNSVALKRVDRSEPTAKDQDTKSPAANVPPGK